MIEVYGFNKDGSIDATIDGIRMMVPDDMENRHRVAIADWVAEGNDIPAYEPPEVVEAEISPVEKLAAFLAANPDVAALIG